MVEIPLGGVLPSVPGGTAPVDGTRLLLRVTETLGGGRVVLEAAGIRTEAQLPFPLERGAVIEAVIRHVADRILLEILGPGRSPPAIGATGAAGATGTGEAAGVSASLPADMSDLLATLGVAETAETRAAASALAAEGSPVTAELVREVAAALSQLGRSDAAAAEAAARMIAAGMPPAAGLVAATSGAGAQSQLAEALSAMAALTASDPSLIPLADEVASFAIPPGDGEALRGHFDSAAGRLAAVLSALEGRAAAQLSASARLATLDRLIELASPRAAQATAGAIASAPPPLDGIIAPDGSMLPGAEAAVQALSPDGAAALLSALVDAERAELSRSPVSPDLARATRSVRTLLSRSALARAASMAEPGAQALTIDVPFAVGDRTIVARLHIRRGARERQSKGDPKGEIFTVAIGVTMSALGEVTAELRLRGMDLSGTLRLAGGEARRLVESRLDELTDALAEMGFAARITVEEPPAEAASLFNGRGDVSPDIRKLDFRI